MLTHNIVRRVDMIYTSSFNLILCLMTYKKEDKRYFNTVIQYLLL